MGSVTCVVHGGEVDISDTVELPNGRVCGRCYEWMENLLEDEEEAEYFIEIEFEEGVLDD